MFAAVSQDASIYWWLPICVISYAFCVLIAVFR